jgi:hypothetical protein
MALALQQVAPFLAWQKDRVPSQEHLHDIACALPHVSPQHRQDFVSAASAGFILARTDRAKELLPPTPLRVGPSSVHGTGVFTTRDVRAQEFLGLYPADAVLAAEYYVGRINPEIGHRYMQFVAEDVAIVGNPAQATDEHYVAHLVNDGAKLSRDDPRAERIYELVSATKANCTYDQDMLCLVATKDIRAGEELFYSYGKQYWRGLF